MVGVVQASSHALNPQAPVAQYLLENEPTQSGSCHRVDLGKIFCLKLSFIRGFLTLKNIQDSTSYAVKDKFYEITFKYQTLVFDHNHKLEVN